LAPDKLLLKEVTKELWHTIKKLRPELGREPRMQLVLKALITIGDLPNPIEAAMVVAVCIEMEEGPDESLKSDSDEGINISTESKEGRRTVRRRSAAS
tara:strand:- start:1037 stop:1330 length:294 start_codon:yes stop_codon:yes gene_type:complete